MKVTGINHITFATANIELSVDFYTNILGAEIVARWETGAYLMLGKLWLCLSYDKQTKTEACKDYTHIAFDIKPEDFHQLQICLANNDIIRWKENESEGLSCYILDPDFNKLEIHASSLNARIKSMRHKPYPGLVLNEGLISQFLLDDREN